MKRKVISASLTLILVLCLIMAVPAFASGSDADTAEEILVYDEADLLTDGEEYTLNANLLAVSHEHRAQLIVVTLSSMDGGDIDEFDDYLYDEMGFGYTEYHDGVMLLVCMDPREYRILSNGFAGNAITSGEIDAIGSAIVSDLSDGNYADAFDDFADRCDYYLGGYLNGYPFNFGRNLLIALAVGILAGLIVALSLKAQLKSVRRKDQANDYVKSGSMEVTVRRDLFLYRTVSRTKKESSSSGSSGSGSRSSRSSGGGSF